jgi:hypothetical protein
MEPYRRREQPHEYRHKHAAIDTESIDALFIVNHEATQGITRRSKDSSARSRAITQA